MGRKENKDCHIHTFANGIRWVHKEVKHTKVAHCGMMVDIGSRDERPEELGIAHFWEHMAFKGTKTKNSAYILNRIDKLGGELNAYTTKEKICFHSSLLSRHFEKAVELLSDITFNSVFPEKEIEKEKQVILEEMSMYEDNPEDAIQDQFDDHIFHGNPLGNNILGTRESVSGFKQEDFYDFINANMSTDRMVFSTVGNLSVVKAERIIKRYFEEIPVKKAFLNRSNNHFKSKKHEIVKKAISQAHVMIGRPAYSLHHPDRLIFFMICNLLGGPAMNARLNLAVREKYGLAYTIDSQYSPYTDTGLFSIYFGTEKKYIDKTTKLVLQELRKLRDLKLNSGQLRSTKEQLKGQLAMSEENNNGFMLMMAKSMLDLGMVESLESIFTRIDNITAEDIQRVASEMFNEEQLNYLIFEPEK